MGHFLMSDWSCLRVCLIVNDVILIRIFGVPYYFCQTVMDVEMEDIFC